MQQITHIIQAVINPVWKKRKESDRYSDDVPELLQSTTELPIGQQSEGSFDTTVLTLPHATEALSGYSLILIFASTRPSAKSSLPLAIAPTKTATECVSGSVGRYLDNLIVGASPDSAVVLRVSSVLYTVKDTLTQFYGVGWQVIRDRVLNGD